MPDEIIHEVASFEIQSTVAEMGDTSADVGPDIPMNAKAVAKIRSQDNDPRFLVLEIEETDRSGAGRIWTSEIIRSIAEQVNKKLPVGYKGHIPEQETGSAFPDVQALWLGASISHRAGKLVARVKGYLLPDSKARQYAEIGAIDGVSVYGDATMVREKGGLRVTKFDLESIDFARKGRAGMPTRIVAVTSEMQEGGKVEAKDIAALDEDELRSHNPLLVAEIERKVKEPLETKIGEQAAAVAAAEPTISAFEEICKKLGIEQGEDPVAAVVALMERVEGAAKEHVKALVDKAIKKLAGKDERAQNLVRRLVGEQVEAEFKDANSDDPKLEGEIEAKVAEMIEADEDVSSIVGEMSGSEGNGGGESFTKHSSSRTENNDNEKGRTGSLKRSKRSIA
jgi:hypothetical protein